MNRIALGAALSSIALLTSTPPVQAEEMSDISTHFVVDVSGSMQGTPLEQAKSALTLAGGNISQGDAVGLRAFAGNCGDGGDLLIPVGPHDPTTFTNAVSSLQAGGGTPTPDALRAAVADLPPEGERRIVLISDGQSGCGDPCVTASELQKSSGVNFTVHTVGYNVGGQASAELTCIAEVTGGNYYDVADAQGLADALNDAIGANSCPEYAVFGLRGSGQTAEDFAGYGYEVAIAKLRLERELKERGHTATYKAIDYQSLGIDYLLRDALSPAISWNKGRGLTIETTAKYADSMWGGSEQLLEAVEEYEARCAAAQESPGKLIMIGYSQGAAAVNWAARHLTTEQQSRSTLVLIGDPLRHTGDTPAAAIGSATPSKGILTLPQTRTTTIFHPLRGRLAANTVTLCNARDVVCDAKDALMWNGLSIEEMQEVHLAYSAPDLALAGITAYRLASRP